MIDKTNIPQVAVHLATTHTQDGTTTTMKQDFVGQFFAMGQALYLRYREPEENATVTFKLQQDGKVVLTRTKHDASLRLFFGDQQRIAATYRTPYGMIPIETMTPYLSLDLTDSPNAGKIALDYDLYSGGQKLGSYQIRLQFARN